MLSWYERPVEVANLLNPAFCSIVLDEAISGYQTETQNGFDYPLSVLILPITLHERTSNLLPKKISTKMHVWIKDHPEVQVNFADRTKRLVTYTREAIIFGIQGKLFDLSPNGRLIVSRKTIKMPSSWKDSQELLSYLEAARFVGRWFAQAKDITTIYFMWGISP